MNDNNNNQKQFICNNCGQIAYFVNEKGAFLMGWELDKRKQGKSRRLWLCDDCSQKKDDFVEETWSANQNVELDIGAD